MNSTYPDYILGGTYAINGNYSDQECGVNETYWCPAGKDSPGNITIQYIDVRYPDDYPEGDTHAYVNYFSCSFDFGFPYDSDWFNAVNPIGNFLRQRDGTYDDYNYGASSYTEAKWYYSSSFNDIYTDVTESATKTFSGVLDVSGYIDDRYSKFWSAGLEPWTTLSNKNNYSMWFFEYSSSWYDIDLDPLQDHWEGDVWVDDGFNPSIYTGDAITSSNSDSSAPLWAGAVGNSGWTFAYPTTDNSVRNIRYKRGMVKCNRDGTYYVINLSKYYMSGAPVGSSGVDLYYLYDLSLVTANTISASEAKEVEYLGGQPTFPMPMVAWTSGSVTYRGAKQDEYTIAVPATGSLGKWVNYFIKQTHGLNADYGKFDKHKSIRIGIRVSGSIGSSVSSSIVF